MGILSKATKFNLGKIFGEVAVKTGLNWAGYITGTAQAIGYTPQPDKGLNIFNWDVRKLALEAEQMQRQLAKIERTRVRAELTGRYNEAISRFGKGPGLDIAAPQKASFRKTRRFH